MKRLLLISLIFFTACTTLPAVEEPSQVQAFAGAGFVDISWQDNSESETGFLIVRRLPNSNRYVEVAIVDADMTFYRDTRVVPGESYIYGVAALCTGPRSRIVEYDLSVMAY